VLERVVKVLNENEVAVLMKTVVDEFEFPQYIVKRLDTSEERVFTHNGLTDGLSEFAQAEKYYNYLSYDLYYDRSHSISKW
jgi:hypothetical protein